MKIWLSNFCTVRWLLIVLGLRYLQLRQFATATLSKMALPLALTGIVMLNGTTSMVLRLARDAAGTCTDYGTCMPASKKCQEGWAHSAR